jgi:GNAT superfamily N-acetyltransferase
MAGVIVNYFFEQNGKYVRIVPFVISSSFGNKGIGKQLLKAVEDWANKMGATSIFLNCGNRDERKQAHKFYQNCGYQIKSPGYVKS